MTLKAKLALLYIFFFITFVSTCFYILQNMDEVISTYRQSVITQEQILKDSYRLAKEVIDLETGQRGFVITGKDEFLEPYNEAKIELNKTISSLKENLRDNPKHLRQLALVERMISDWIETAGIPEIQARRLVTSSGVDLKMIEETVLSGSNEKILDEIRIQNQKLTGIFQRDNKMAELVLMTEIGKNLVDAEVGQRGFLLTGESSFLKRFYDGKEQFKVNSQSLKTRLAEDNLELLSAIEILFQNWLVQAADPEIALRKKYDKNPQSIADVAQILSRGEGKNQMDKMRVAISGLSESLEADIRSQLEWAEENVAYTNRISIAVVVASIAAISVIVFIISQSLLASINELNRSTQLIGSGGLDHRIQLNSKDELQELASSFNEMTQKLQETQQQLLLAAKLASIGEMAASLAHELNQPLEAILLRTDMTNALIRRDEGIDEIKAARNMDKIVHEVDRASKIVQHLRIFSRQEPMVYEEADINWIVAESLTLLKETLRINGIDLVLDLAEDLPKVNCDYIQIVQVLTNLINNARDALNDRSEPQVVIRSYLHNDHICVDVEDNGIGIPENIKHKIFDPFFTTKPVGSGTGLGTSISHGIATEHRGSLSVQSREGMGSTFTLALPLHSADYLQVS